MTDSGLNAARKPLTHTALFGLATLTLYFLLYLFEDAILAFTTRGGWYFIAPVAIAFVVSYVHGHFTSHFWDLLGIQAKK